MPDTERSQATALHLVTDSEGEETEQEQPPAQPAAEPPRRGPGRPKGVRNGEGKGKKKRASKPKGPARKKAAAKKPETKTQTRKRAMVAVRSAELRERSKLGDADAKKLLANIQSKHRKWTSALEKKSRVSQECGQRLKAAEAAFQNAIEAPLEVGKVELTAVRGKLEACEMRWGELSDTKAQNIEERKGARDDVKAALEALNEAVEDSRQQRLPGVV